MGVSNSRSGIVEPRGEHKATIIWLHDNDFSNSRRFVQNLHLDNIKWIVLDSGIRSLGIDSAATHVAYKLSTEKKEVLIGVGGIGAGAQLALHFATKCVLGDYRMNPLVVIAINNGSLFTSERIESYIESTPGAKDRAKSQSILLTCAESHISTVFRTTISPLRMLEFGVVDVETYSVPDHEVLQNSTDMVRAWLNDKLQLDPN